MADTYLAVALATGRVDYPLSQPIPLGGVVEDPATGAAAAALGGYLRAIGHVNECAQLTIVQGEDMGRPSTLLLSVDPDDARVMVAGTAVRIEA